MVKDVLLKIAKDFSGEDPLYFFIDGNPQWGLIVKKNEIIKLGEGEENIIYNYINSQLEELWKVFKYDDYALYISYL